MSQNADLQSWMDAARAVSAEARAANRNRPSGTRRAHLTVSGPDIAALEHLQKSIAEASGAKPSFAAVVLSVVDPFLMIRNV